MQSLGVAACICLGLWVCGGRNLDPFSLMFKTHNSLKTFPILEHLLANNLLF